MPALTDTSVRRLTLSSSDAAEIGRIAQELCAGTHGEVDDPTWVATVRRAADRLPLTLRQELRNFRRHSGGLGALLVSNLPMDEAALLPTPSVDGSVQRAVSTQAAILLLVACLLGDPTSFRDEKSGALVQDVVPVPGKESFQGNAGSVLLSYHNENAFHEHRPDYVMLLCLRTDHERIAGLRAACIREVLPILSDESREVLFSTEFVTEPPPSFGLSGEPTPPHAVLFGAPDDPELRVDLAATTPLTPRAERALAELGQAFEKTGQTVRLVPGDLAIVDNHVTVHGRSEFTPRYDGRDRWLQRTFVATDLRRSRDHRPGDGYVLARSAAAATTGD
jgi:L-asparagine oxygenase